MYVALKFAYDGRKFNGYARQPQQKTVEGEIIKALIKNGFVEDTTESNFRSASRTDKGVSALGNVVAFETDSSKKNIFQMLKNDLQHITVYGFKNVAPNFIPRHAKQRRYRYYLKNKNIDFDNFIAAASSFAGEYDFSNFAKLEEFKDPVRTIDNIIINSQDDFVIIDFYAQTFLWNQIRRMVSAIQKIVTGKIEKEQVIEALHNTNKKVDFGLAPAEPLILIDIIYDFDFEFDNKLRNSLKNLEELIVSSL